MPIEVELPDGSIAEFPDGTSDETIERVLRQEFEKTRETGFGPVLRDLPSVSEFFLGRDVEPVELIPTGRDISRGEAVRQAGEGLLRGAAQIPDILIPGGDPVQEELMFRGLLRPEEEVDQIPLGRGAEFVVPGLLAGGAATRVAPLAQQAIRPALTGAAGAGGAIGVLELLRRLGVDVGGLLGISQ